MDGRGHPDRPWEKYQTQGDHPYTDPGDGRTECRTCGKWIREATHSCKQVPVTEAAWKRMIGEE